tara:strand:+ start:5440 stop:6090 length:651 start_codon:yes stop_codon:yes gene_type:complete
MEYLKYNPSLSNNWSRAQNHVFKHTPWSVNRIVDSMTTSQLQSKLWLGTEIDNLNTKFDNVMVLGGWYCHALAEILIGNLNVGFVCNYDIDPDVQIMSYKFNKRYKDAGKFKASRRNLFMSNIDNDQQKNGPVDLVINPSCEHMWHMKNIRDKHFASDNVGPVYALQSTDEKKYDDHINCVSDPDELADQAGLIDVYYSGTMVLDNGMNRFMVIGR